MIALTKAEEAAAQLGDRRLYRLLPSAGRVLNGWYLTCLLITFGGGAALGDTMARRRRIPALSADGHYGEVR